MPFTFGDKMKDFPGILRHLFPDLENSENGNNNNKKNHLYIKKKSKKGINLYTVPYFLIYYTFSDSAFGFHDIVDDD